MDALIGCQGAYQEIGGFLERNGAKLNHDLEELWRRIVFNTGSGSKKLKNDLKLLVKQLAYRISGST